MSHGNYRRVTHEEVYQQSIEQDFTIVSLDSVVYRGSGKALEVLHVVAPHTFYKQDTPVGYSVQLMRPNWLYGSEGQLFELPFIGRISDDWLDWSDNHPDLSDDDDPFPECCDFVWGLPNQQWNSSTKSYDSVPWKHTSSWDWWKEVLNEDAVK